MSRRRREQRRENIALTHAHFAESLVDVDVFAALEIRLRRSRTALYLWQHSSFYYFVIQHRRDRVHELTASILPSSRVTSSCVLLAARSASINGLTPKPRRKSDEKKTAINNRKWFLFYILITAFVGSGARGGSHALWANATKRLNEIDKKREERVRARSYLTSGNEACLAATAFLSSFSVACNLR